MNMSKLLLVFPSLILGAGCTTLGAMPGLTGASYRPGPRAGLEVQFGGLPGYHLSDVPKDPSDSGEVKLNDVGILQGAVWGNLGKYIAPVEGLGVGARIVDLNAGDTYVEPMLRYRFHLDDEKRIGNGITLYGTHASGAEDGASYEMTRAGLEVGLDLRVTPKNRWAELHVGGGASLTLLNATGTYCEDGETGFARQCDKDDPDTPGVDETEMGGRSTDIFGLYPGAYVNISGDFFTGVPYFHGFRVTLYSAGGSRPSVVHGEQEDGRGWFAAGFLLSFAVGER